jgi:hypothetical protein
MVVAGLTAVVVIASGALAVACDGTGEVLSTPTASPAQLLSGIPNSEIDGSTNSDRMELAALDASPGVSADAAVRTAKMQQPNASVLQTVLIDYTNLVQPSPSTRLAWVVNFDPATVVPIPPGGCMTNCPREDQLRQDWFYVLIDANTSEVIHSEGATSVVTDTPTPAPSSVSLAGVPNRALSDRHIQLLAPDASAKPTISKDRAEAAGTQPGIGEPNGGKARETVLARLVITGIASPVDRLVWAVNLDPTSLAISPIAGGPLQGGPTPESPLVPQYAVWFIDAQTGEDVDYISAATQDGPPPPTDAPLATPSS